MKYFSLALVVATLILTCMMSVVARADWEPIGPLWAFEETFDHDPASPSQALLPKRFDYVVTHRIHPRDMFDVFSSYPADHGTNCAGPAPPNPAMHDVVTSHFTNSNNPDESFFICKNHMMSSMGDVSGYSVTSFWPKQEFRFINGGVLEFDVNINHNPGRFWFEVVIMPREQMKVAAAHEFFPIDETYPEDRILLELSPSSKRSIWVGSGQVSPNGWLVKEDDWRDWSFIAPDDPANTDRRIRRTMRITFNNNDIVWEIQKQDGTFDAFTAQVSNGYPFAQGLVMFKTHAYTPHKADNFDNTTWHWDNIRFSGQPTGLYRNYESEDFVYLQANGNRPVGDTARATIDIDKVGMQPVLFGQIHSPKSGQVRLSINSGPARTVHPQHYKEDNGCYANGWSSFYLPISVDELVQGVNTFDWTVAESDGCEPSWVWDGFSIKDFEIQFGIQPGHQPFLIPGRLGTYATTR